jgi:D-glycero-alpha-D-manno-heptose-7-phosphate kinase
MPLIKIKKPARVDFFGGTLDIPPLNLILPHVVTINGAIHSFSEVSIVEHDKPEILIRSEDYQWEQSFSLKTLEHTSFASWGAMRLIGELIDLFPWKTFYQNNGNGFSLHFRSDIPPGSGLGGSSVLAMTLYETLCQFFNHPYSSLEALEVVKNVEAKVLSSGPTGYQDYYPCEYGGLLALEAHPRGIRVHQHYDEHWNQFLQQHITLFYSGQSRFSAINNWEVYKSYFDQNIQMKKHLEELAHLSFKAWQILQAGEHSAKQDHFLQLLIQEGELRQSMFPQLRTPPMNDFLKLFSAHHHQVGLKVCGAGGGGCFFMIHPPHLKEKVIEQSKQFGFQLMNHTLVPPLRSCQKEKHDS